MSTAGKIFGIAAALVLVAVVGIAIVIASLDVQTMVAPIRTYVKEATGRDLAIGGIDVKLSLVPTIVLTDVTIGNAPWGKAPHLAAAKRLEAQMTLRPLLERRFEIVRVALIEPVIALETNGKGQRNWIFEGDPAARAPAAGPKAGPAAGPAPAAVSPLPAAFGVGEFAIDRGALTYHDVVAAATHAVAIDSFTVKARDLRAAIGVRFRGRIDDLALAVDGTVGPLDASQLQRGPYPLDLTGEIAGRKLALRTRLDITGGGYRFSDLALAYGTNDVKGEFAMLPGAVRPQLTFRLAADAIAVAELPLPPVARPPVAPGNAARARSPAHVFADDPVSFAFLRAADVDGELAIGKLTLPNGHRLDKVHGRLALHDARLDLSSLQAMLFGGSALVHLQIDGTREQKPALKLRLDAKGLDLAALLAATGDRREVRGGKTDIELDLALHGVSPRQWASGVTGNATVVVGKATLVNAKASADSPFNRLASIVNPFRDIDATTEFECGVIRLPLANGVARVDHSIAMETAKLGVSANGTVDLRSETLDLAIKPRVKQGVTVKLLQLASLVHLKGSIAAPAVGVDAAASAQTLARLGAAFASGGLSVLGETLLSGVVEHGAECDVALGREPPTGGANAKPAPSSRAAPPAAPPAPKTEGLGGLLRLLPNR